MAIHEGRVHFHAAEGLVEADQLGVALGAKGAPEAEVVDGLEEVGLALAVFADQDIERRPELDRCARQIAEIRGLNPVDEHSGAERYRLLSR